MASPWSKAFATWLETSWDLAVEGGPRSNALNDSGGRALVNRVLAENEKAGFIDEG